VAVAGDHLAGARTPRAFVTTRNPRRALALAAAKFFPRQPQPSQPSPAPAARPRLPPSPGRSGSGSVTHRPASETIGLVSPKRTIYGSLTTPDPIALHRQLDEIAREASPMRSRRHRTPRSVSPRAFASAPAGFTNLSRDPHGLPSRRRALSRRQARLFRDLVAADGAAVIRPITIARMR